jgi:16S rRNA (cytosine967-C5)-methyltransferase
VEKYWVSKSKKLTILSPRAAAAKVIANVLRGQSLSTLLPEYADSVAEQDRSLFKEMCFGSLRWYPQIAILIKQLVPKPLKEKDLEIQGLLACGLYQLVHMRISEHASVNETVAATKALNRIWAKGLVNAVLRTFQREKLALLDEHKDHLVFQNAHPKWLIKKLNEAWHQNDVLAIIEANNQRGPMTLRVNTTKVSRNDYLAKLKDAGIQASKTPNAPSGIQLVSAVDVKQLPEFAAGAVSVQDEAAQLAASLLQLESGHRVLDACCAPGGKTCHILELQPRIASLVAVDSEPRRLIRVEENLTRLDLSAQLIAADAGELDSWWDRKPFQRILLDAPCSATGVIRRHPDIKILRKPADIDKLTDIQTRLLQRLWQTLSNGGILVYATCSVLPEENDHIIKSFIEGRVDAEVINIQASWGKTTPYGRQLFPVPEGHDGFYYAKLRKVGQTTESLATLG